MPLKFVPCKVGLDEICILRSCNVVKCSFCILPCQSSRAVRAVRAGAVRYCTLPYRMTGGRYAAGIAGCAEGERLR